MMLEYTHLHYHNNAGASNLYIQEKRNWQKYFSLNTEGYPLTERLLGKEKFIII